MLASAAAFLLLALVLYAFGSLAYGAVSAAPWVPLGKADIDRLLKLLALKPGERLIDLGCGDGRIVEMAARRYGVQAIGYEVAVLPYLLAHLRRVLSPARQLMQIRLANFWDKDLSQAQAIVCFLTPMAMPRLEPKLARELTSGARFASYAFKLPNSVPVVVNKPNPRVTSIYVYTEIVQPGLGGG